MESSDPSPATEASLQHDGDVGEEEDHGRVGKFVQETEHEGGRQMIAAAATSDLGTGNAARSSSSQTVKAIKRSSQIRAQRRRSSLGRRVCHRSSSVGSISSASREDGMTRPSSSRRDGLMTDLRRLASEITLEDDFMSASDGSDCNYGCEGRKVRSAEKQRSGDLAVGVTRDAAGIDNSDSEKSLDFEHELNMLEEAASRGATTNISGILTGRKQSRSSFQVMSSLRALASIRDGDSTSASSGSGFGRDRTEIASATADSAFRRNGHRLDDDDNNNEDYDRDKISKMIETAVVRTPENRSDDGVIGERSTGRESSATIVKARRSSISKKAQGVNTGLERGSSRKESLMSSLRALAISLDDESLLFDDDKSRDKGDAALAAVKISLPSGKVPGRGADFRRGSWERKAKKRFLCAMHDSDDSEDNGSHSSDTNDHSTKPSLSEYAQSTCIGGSYSTEFVDAPCGAKREGRKGDDRKSASSESSCESLGSLPPHGSSVAGTNVHFKLLTDGTFASSDVGGSDLLFMSNPDAQSIAQNFAAEHRIFLRAALELLADKDKFALEEAAAAVESTESAASPFATGSSASVMIKTGSLKKASHLMRGVWKAKYVEIRRGFFTYYGNSPDDSDSDELDLSKKVIPLETTRCKCRAVRVRNKPLAKDTGYIFELRVEGFPKRLWMASSKKERQSWIRAVHEAMVGPSWTKGDNYFEYHAMHSCEGNSLFAGVPLDSPHRDDLEQYLDVQERLKHAESKFSYLGGLYELWKNPIRIPVQWIRVQMERSENAGHAFNDNTACSGIDQLWKDMLRDSVSINGMVIKGDSGHGPERIIGALTKCIMDFDRSCRKRRHKDVSCSPSEKRRKTPRINEPQGIAYARDILLACNRTRSAGDSYYCMDNLCNNAKLVALCPYSSEAQPLQIIVKHATVDDGSIASGSDKHQNSVRDWLSIRTSSVKRQWSEFFCVLSDGLLTYYEKEQPKPHRLRGQLSLGEAISINTTSENVASYSKPQPLDESTPLLRGSRDEGALSDDSHQSGILSTKLYVISISCQDGSKDMHLRFEDEAKFLVWREILQQSVDADSRDFLGINPASRKLERTQSRSKNSIKAVNLGGPKRANSIRIERDDNETRSDGKTKRQGLKGHATPTVQVFLEACTVYKICTTDPEGNEGDDTWATLQTKFVQSFQMSGGPQGRIMRGEEIVQMLFLEGLADGEAFDRALEKDESRPDLLEGLSQRNFFAKRTNQSAPL